MLAIQDKSNASTIEQVDRVIKKGIKDLASDLHFEPLEENIRVRYRKDGLLHEIACFPKSQANMLLTRLKVMGNLDISEQRLPQDGRFHFTVGKTKVDCRLSTCPTLWGEKIVVRLLNAEQSIRPLDNLGMDNEQKTMFHDAISRPQGLILVTGPTGSGKTVTLYTALNEIHCGKKNILTIEDPIEIQLSGINQTNVQPKIGLTFASALRAFLRQDPDVIMIGEIRDEETAKIAIRAAQTGHLVFSTLHTNSAFESIARLTNLGIPYHDMLTSLNLVVSQRLIRILCPLCKQAVNSEKTTKTGSSVETKLHMVQSPTQTYQPLGCDHCLQGYQGRTGIFEMISLPDVFQEKTGTFKNKLWFQHQNPIKPLKLNVATLSLKESAQKKVFSGITSQAELKRVIG